MQPPLIPKRPTEEILKHRNSYQITDQMWSLYNAEFRFTQAYRAQPDSLDTMAWGHIYRENLRLMKGCQAPEKKWKITPQQNPIFGHDPLISNILLNRGITSNVEDFIESPLEKIDNTVIDGTEDAVAFIIRAINKKVPITVYGDYDADGITGTALMVDALRRIGAKADYYINSRSDGYAVNEAGMRTIASRGLPRLVITVDNGISSHEAINFARNSKMGVIVTDHHEANEMPRAHVIVHPGGFSTKLAGVGVAYKLVHHLFEKLQRKDIHDYLDLAAIGTIGDVVPLLGENRVIAKHGLQKLNRQERPAIKALSKIMKLKNIDSGTVAYKIAPVINALSRMTSVANQAVEFLLTEDQKKANLMAEYLVSLNEKRKEIVRQEAEKAEEFIAPEDNIIIIPTSAPEGIIGVIAGHIKEQYNRPTIILSEKAEYLTGSFRSVKEFHATNALLNCDLEKAGGHALAAGFLLKKDKYPEFCYKIGEQVKNISFSPPSINIDAKLDEIDEDLIEKIESLQPYGESFPQPIFMKECIPSKVQEIGTGHLKINNGSVEYLFWNAFGKIQQTDRLSIAGTPAFSDYNGKMQFIVKDYRFVSSTTPPRQLPAT